MHVGLEAFELNHHHRQNTPHRQCRRPRHAVSIGLFNIARDVCRRHPRCILGTPRRHSTIQKSTLDRAMMKQVDRSHYAFPSYESPERFTSYYYQVLAIQHFRPRSILEVGVGSGTLAALARCQGIDAMSVDIDHDLHPTVTGDILSLPFRAESVDVVAAFQILEHLPFDQFGGALKELARVARAGIALSLPEFGNAAITVSVPFVRKLHLSGRALPHWYPRHRFDGQHYWEINKRGYRRDQIIKVINSVPLTVGNSWLNPYNPYHHFFTLHKH